MGLFDNLLGQLASADGIQALIADNPQLVQAAQRLFGDDAGLGGADGLQGILDQLQAGGLGDLVSSWLGSGPNQPVEPGQLEQALGGDLLSRFAESAGASGSNGGSLLAGLLPQLVDSLSPDGRLAAPPSDLGALIGGMLDGRRG